MLLLILLRLLATLVTGVRCASIYASSWCKAFGFTLVSVLCSTHDPPPPPLDHLIDAFDSLLV